MLKTIAVSKQENYRTEIRANSHHFIVDEPISVGGKDLGPTPGELVAAALASCSSITMKMYADRKGWELEEVEVEVDYETDAQKKLTRFTKNIRFQGNLDATQREKLYEIAAKCPIHRLLMGQVEVNSKLL